jgi:hypothetical protein
VIEDDAYGISYATHYGFGMNFDLGEEWWVGDSWGLGVAARFWYTAASEGDQPPDADWTFMGGALLFSATYQ